MSSRFRGTLTAVVAFVVLATWSFSAAAATVTESALAPTTNVIESVDRANVVASPLNNLFKINATSTGSQHLGQSFQFATPFTISGVTIQYSTSVSAGAEAFTYAAGQTLRLNITEDTNGDLTPDSIVTFEDFDVSGRTAQNFEYWTFTPTTPTAKLDANKTYGFMFEWQTTDGNNIFRTEVDATNPYAGGGELAQFDPTTLFPTPSAGTDLTFYLQGELLPPAPEPSTLALVSLGVAGLACGRRRRRMS